MLKKKENQKLALRYCNYLRECLEEMVTNDLTGDDLEEMLTNVDHYQTDLHRAIYAENQLTKEEFKMNNKINESWTVLEQSPLFIAREFKFYDGLTRTIAISEISDEDFVIYNNTIEQMDNLQSDEWIIFETQKLDYLENLEEIRMIQSACFNVRGCYDGQKDPSFYASWTEIGDNPLCLCIGKEFNCKDGYKRGVIIKEYDRQMFTMYDNTLEELINLTEELWYGSRDYTSDETKELLSEEDYNEVLLVSRYVFKNQY